VLAVSVITSYFLKILEALSDDQLQKGDTRREAKNIANKMYEIQLVLMLNFWNETMKKFHQTSQLLQCENVLVNRCRFVACSSLADLLHTSRDEF